MKRLIYIALLSLFFSCEKSPITCSFSGEQVNKTISLDDFDQVEVNTQIVLTLIDTNFNEMRIKADKNVINNIDYEIVNGKLVIKNNTNCVVQNDDAVANIQLYVDDISQIIANTDLSVKSGNLWQFNDLSLICENAILGNNNIADFDIDFGGNRLSVTANGSSIFYIRGTAQHLFVGFYGVNPIFHGENFEVQNIRLYHRCSGDMHLFPIDAVTGDLFGYGDIYLHHYPTQVQITQHYAGHIYIVN